MKKLLTLCLALLTALSLVTAAHADVISSPAAVAAILTLRYLPWILVGLVVLITALLLRKFWKKK